MLVLKVYLCHVNYMYGAYRFDTATITLDRSDVAKLKVI